MGSRMPGHVLDYFERIYVINLRSRPDRKRDLMREFSAIGFSAQNVRWFEAIKPDDRGPFMSIGVRGCFLSHLGILKLAEAEAVGSVLILEDDVSFVNGFSERLTGVVETLQSGDWDVFYGGGGTERQHPVAPGLALVEPQDGVGCAHFIALRDSAIGRVRQYIEAQLARPHGDPAGGPMPVDGSYSWARRALGLRTLIAAPELCFQRSSRSDITPRAWDRIGGLRNLATLWRNVKQRLDLGARKRIV